MNSSSCWCWVAVHADNNVAGFKPCAVRRTFGVRIIDEKSVWLIQAQRLDRVRVEFPYASAKAARLERRSSSSWRRSGPAVLRDCERGLRRQEQQREQHAAKHRVKRLERNAYAEMFQKASTLLSHATGVRKKIGQTSRRRNLQGERSRRIDEPLAHIRSSRRCPQTMRQRSRGMMQPHPRRIFRVMRRDMRASRPDL